MRISASVWSLGVSVRCPSQFMTFVILVVPSFVLLFFNIVIQIIP